MCNHCSIEESSSNKLKVYDQEQEGEQKLCPACYNLVSSSKEPSPLAVRPVKKDDLELVLAWRNSISSNKPFFINQNAEIGWDDMTTWFDSRGDHTDYIIQYKHRPVGVVSIGGTDLVSMYVGVPELWDQGIGPRVLNWIAQWSEMKSVR